MTAPGPGLGAEIESLAELDGRLAAGQTLAECYLQSLDLTGHGAQLVATLRSTLRPPRTCSVVAVHAYLVAPEHQLTDAARAINSVLPSNVPLLPVPETSAGTALKQEILVSATHIVIYHPGPGGLSLLFAALRQPYGPTSPRILVHSLVDLRPLLAYAEPEEQHSLTAREQSGALIFMATLDAEALERFLG